MINRYLLPLLESMLSSHKAVILMGARQVGKSTLLQLLLEGRKDVLWLNGDNQDIQSLFTTVSAERIRTLMGDKHILVLDEAQRIPNVGVQLKIIIDQLQDVQVIATGSSSFELASKVNEPLTGRKREFKLFPLSFSELSEHTSLLEELRLIPHRLVYGYYPEVVTSPGQEAVILKELTDSYLYRDILTLLEESDGILQAFEFKWNTHKKTRCPLAFANAYPEATFRIITPANIDDFLRL